METSQRHIRESQAKLLWNKGFGIGLSIDTFDDYLATIPEIPEGLTVYDERFPELVLVDARLGIVKTCELLGIEYEGEDQTFEQCFPKQARTEQVYWIRMHDGKRNRNKRVIDCHQEFAGTREIGLTIHEGLALFAQHPEVFGSWSIDLINSVERGARDQVATLNWLDARPKLRSRLEINGLPFCGSGSRLK